MTRESFIFKSYTSRGKEFVNSSQCPVYLSQKKAFPPIVLKPDSECNFGEGIFEIPREGGREE
jgi:hypothetical protein